MSQDLFQTTETICSLGIMEADIELKTSNMPNRVSSTIGRIWKARESSNDVGTVRLDFDLSQWSISGMSDLEMIVSKHSDLSNYKNITGYYNASKKNSIVYRFGPRRWGLFYTCEISRNGRLVSFSILMGLLHMPIWETISILIPVDLPFQLG